MSFSRRKVISAQFLHLIPSLLHCHRTLISCPALSGASQQDKSSQFQSQEKLIHISVGYFFMENVIGSIDCGTRLQIPRTGGP